MIFFNVGLNTIYDSSNPLNNEIFKTISLVEISVHELFHSLSRKSRFLAFLIILDFLSVNVIYKVFELFESESSCFCLSNRFVPIASCLRLSENSLS